MERKYNGGLTREQFLFFETKILAELLTQGYSQTEAIDRIVAENLFQFLTYPASLALILLILIICSVLSLAEISAIISGFAMLYEKKSISVFLMIKSGFKSIGKLLKKFNFILVFYILLILPLTQFTLTSGIFAFVGMPSVQTLYGTASNKIFFAVNIYYKMKY